MAFNRKRISDFLVTNLWAGKLSLFLLSSSGFINHSLHNNVVVKLMNNQLCFMTIKDMIKGDEILLNYHFYPEVDFYNDWCQQHHVHWCKHQIMQLAEDENN